MVLPSDCILISCFLTSRLGEVFSMGTFSEQMSQVASTRDVDEPGVISCGNECFTLLDASRKGRIESAKELTS